MSAWEMDDGAYRVEGQHLGRVLLKTVHRSRSGAQAEVKAWIARMKRGEADAIFIFAPNGEPSKKITLSNWAVLPTSWGGLA